MSAPEAGADHPPARVLLLSGPNLNLLGQREPHIYGPQTLADHEATAGRTAADCGLRLESRQYNREGDLVEALHQARSSYAGVILNAGALTHYSWSLHDAVAAFGGPVIELHLSNPAAREPFRHLSVLAPVVKGSIAGFGGLGYELAVRALARILEEAS